MMSTHSLREKSYRIFSRPLRLLICSKTKFLAIINRRNFESVTFKLQLMFPNYMRRAKRTLFITVLYLDKIIKFFLNDLN